MKKTTPKYELIKSRKRGPNDAKLFQIKALRDFSDVKAGDLGGFVQGERNLSYQGACWLYDKTEASGDSVVKDNAVLRDSAFVCGNAVVKDNAIIRERGHAGGHAVISEFAEIFGASSACGEAKIRGHVRLFGEDAVVVDAHISGNVDVYGGTDKDDQFIIEGFFCITGNAIVSQYTGDNPIPKALRRKA